MSVIGQQKVLDHWNVEIASVFSYGEGNDDLTASTGIADIVKSKLYGQATTLTRPSFGLPSMDLPDPRDVPGAFPDRPEFVFASNKFSSDLDAIENHFIVCIFKSNTRAGVGLTGLPESFRAWGRAVSVVTGEVARGATTPPIKTVTMRVVRWANPHDASSLAASKEWYWLNKMELGKNGVDYWKIVRENTGFPSG